jgi:hypothetical protein
MAMPALGIILIMGMTMREARIMISPQCFFQPHDGEELATLA